MSSEYLISSMQKEDYQLDIPEFKKYLEEHWTGIEFDASSSAHYALRWSFKYPERDDYYFLGGLQDNHLTVTLKFSSYQMLADFAIWYRTLIPANYNLFVWKAETWETPVELTYKTVPEDILRGFHQI